MNDNKIKILTTNWKFDNPTWLKNVDVLHDWREAYVKALQNKKINSYLFNIKWGFNLFIASRKYDAIVTGFDKLAIIYSLLNKLCIFDKKHHIFLFAYWNFPDNNIKRRIKLFLYRFILKSKSTLIVYGNHQKLLHDRYFNIGEGKIHVIPYHVTIGDMDVNVKDDGYIFTGGDTARDYRTLINAMVGLPFSLKIAALSKAHFYNLKIPENVIIKSISNKEFFEWMSNSSIVIVPLKNNLLQAGGQQTFLNAMYMGKPVIVADDNSAFEYIQDGKDGFVVEPGNVEKLREKIILLMEDVKLREQIGKNAKIAAGNYPPERYINGVLEYANHMVSRQKNYV